MKKKLNLITVHKYFYCYCSNVKSNATKNLTKSWLKKFKTNLLHVFFWNSCLNVCEYALQDYTAL